MRDFGFSQSSFEIMTIRSRAGLIVAGAYLAVVSVAMLSLMHDGYVGHGNAIAYMFAIIITSPLSIALIALGSFLYEVNAFYITGWQYCVALLELLAGALLNAVLIYRLVRQIAPGKNLE